MVLMGLVGVLSTLAALFGHELALQLENLKLLVPQAFEYMNQYLTQYLQTHPAVYEWLAGLEWARELRDNPQQFLTRFSDGAMAYLPTLFGRYGQRYGNFGRNYNYWAILAISPSVYRRSFVAMVPKDSRDKAEYLLDRSYRSMQQWLLGQLVVMAFVGIATGIALWLMGIPLP